MNTSGTSHLKIAVTLSVLRHNIVLSAIAHIPHTKLYGCRINSCTSGRCWIIKCRSSKVDTFIKLGDVITEFKCLVYSVAKINSFVYMITMQYNPLCAAKLRYF